MAGAKSSEADRENKQKIQQAKFGKKFESMSRDTPHTTKGVAAVVYYLISESDYLSEKGIIQKAPSTIFSNISLPNPNIYYGQPCYEKKKWEYSYAVAEAFHEHFLAMATPEEIRQFNHNQNLKGATASERDEILKAYLVYDHLLTLDPKEAAKLSESEQVELLFAMRERFTLEFTREKKLNHLIQAVPHIKYETETGLYKSHLHILMSSKSYDRKNLDLHNSGLRMFWALNALENDPKFSKSLLPTNTNAARDRFIPTSEAEYKKFRNRMKVILKGATKENIQQILEKHGITIEDFPEPTDGTEKNGADKFVVRMDGKAFNMKYLMDREKTLLESHQLYDKASNKTQLVMHEVANLIKSKKHQSITELDAALKKMNVYLLPLITAKGQIQGFSLYVADTDTKVKMSTFGITKADLPIDYASTKDIAAVKVIKEGRVEINAVKSIIGKLISENKHTDLIQFSKELEALNIVMVPTTDKAGAIRGVNFNYHGRQIPLNAFQMTFKDLSINEHDPKVVQTLNLIKNRNSKMIHKDLKTGTESEIFFEGNEAMLIDSRGRKRPMFKKKLIRDYPSISDYMADSGGRFSICLKSNFKYDSNRGVFLDKRFNRQALAITKRTDDTLQTTLNSESVAAAKALVQLYLEDGYSAIVITRQGSLKQSQNIWRQAMLQGLKVEGYSPSQADKEWLKAELDKKAQDVIKTNRLAIEAFVATGRYFDVKSVANQWKTVDRSPIGQAFVDMLKNGLDPLMILNPPKNTNHKAEPADLTAQYHKILELVRHQCPARLDAATKALEKFKPEPTPVVVSTPAEAPRPKTEQDVIREYRSAKASEQNAQIERDELKRLQALDKAKEDMKKKT